MAEPVRVAEWGSPSTRAVVAGVIIGGATLLQWLLLNHYSSGPEGIITLPLAFALTIGIGLVCGAVAKHAQRRNVTALMSAVGLLAASWQVCALHPTDGKMAPHHFAWAVLHHWSHPETVRYEDVYAKDPKSVPRRLVARWKYAQALPTRAIEVLYSPAPKEGRGRSLRYASEERGGRWIVLDLDGSGIPLSVTPVEAGDVPTLALEIEGRRWLVSFRSVAGQAPGWHKVESRWQRGEADILVWAWP